MKFPCLLATLTLVAAAGGAQALAARVAPLPPSAEAPLPGELRDRFHDALGRGLTQAGVSGVEVLPGVDVRNRLLANDALKGCSSGPCLADVAKELKADRLAVAEVAVDGKDYTFTLHLYDPRGSEVFHTTERCEICTVREADEALARAAGRLGPYLNRPAPPPPLKEVPAAPPVPVQQAPVAAPAPPPPAAVPLAPGPDEEELRRSHRGYRAAWLSALVVGSVVGAGLIITSVPFWVYTSKDGQTTCGPSVPSKDCPTVYRGNFSAGLGLLVSGLAVGGAGLVTFGVLYAQDRRVQKQRRAGLSIAPVVGGAVAALGGRF